MISVFVVGCQYFQHGRQRGGAHNAGIFSKRIGNGNGTTQRAVCRKTNFIIVFGADKGIGQNAMAAKCNRSLFHAAVEFLLRSQLCLGNTSDNSRWQIIISINTSYFFCNICRTFQIDSEAGRNAGGFIDFNFQCL